MSLPPLHGLPDRAEYDVPRGVEAPSRFSPTEVLRPGCQEPSEGDRGRRLAVAPGQQFHFDSAPRAVTSSGRVEEVNRDVPERNELVPSLLETVVVAAFLQSLGGCGEYLFACYMEHGAQ